MISMQTLVLNSYQMPHKIISWQSAVTMMFNGKVRVLREYDEVIGRIGFEEIDSFEGLMDSLPHRSHSGNELLIKMPAVISLIKSVTQTKRRVQFSRINVFTRDNFRCQYCGERQKMKELNYEHVIPKDQGGKTTWENIVASCYPCNSRKANRTPEQAKMKLLRQPYKPKTLPMASLRMDMSKVPPVWMEFCPAGLDAGEN